ncbi:MAG: carboxypeptidase-like regulatory domain-containing protein, partial [Janthinobacterium lividum]
MKRSHLLKISATAAAAAVLSLSAVQAQTVTGTVTGTVFDSSGAAIPDATVIVINTNTGVHTPTTSNSAGVYSVRFLPIGRYTVEVNAVGFAPFTVPAFQLEISQTARVDAHVSVNANTSVDVSAEVAPILDTSDGTIGLSLSEKQIGTIPLNGR